MAILNDSFDFAQADPSDRFAFRGTPRRVLFRDGDRLLRFTSLPQSGFPGSQMFKSPWWQPQQTFNAIVRTSHRTGASIVDAARAGLAITTNWNPTMEWLVIIELRQPVYGWLGPTKYQPLRSGDRSTLLAGSLPQVYVPGLAADGDGTSSPYAAVFYYGSLLNL